MAFTSNTYTATLDIKRRTPHRPLIIEGDAGVLLDLSLTDNGVAMDITGLYARCVFRRSDGRTVLVSESDDPCPMTVTKATGRIVITVPRTCFRDGDNFLQVQILDGDPDSGTCLSSTFPLLLRAYNCLLTNEAVEESVEFPILEWLIDALRNMTVTGVTIDPDDDGWPTATASLALTDGAYHLTLGIPRGNGIASVVVDSSNPQLIITYEDGTVALAMLNGIASQTWVEAQEYIDADELSAALTDYATKAYVAHAIANAGYYSKPTGGIPASDLSEAVQDSLDLADSAIQEADLAGYYQLPSGGIPSTDMSAAVQLALARANSALQDMAVMEGATSQKNGTKGAVPAPQTTDVNKYLRGDGTWATPSGGGGGGAVDSVNGQTGTVVLDAEDVGAMPSTAIDALLALLSKVAYIDGNGQQYLDALEDALYNRTLSSISAVFTQGQNVIYDTDSLDTLKQYLTVTALYSDSSTEVVTTYTLSGVLAVGTSTITVSYGGETTTFDVTVTHYVPKSDMNGWADGVAYTDLTIIENEYYQSSDGSIQSYSGWNRTGYVPCNGASTITFPILPQHDVTTNPGSNAFFTENHTYISAIKLSKTVAKTITVPANAYYFGISSDAEALATCIENGIVPHA